MSRALTALRDALDRLTPVDVAMARGLAPKEIERLHDVLVSVEAHVADLENELEEIELDRLIAESERAESAKATVGAAP